MKPLDAEALAYAQSSKLEGKDMAQVSLELTQTGYTTRRGGPIMGYTLSAFMTEQGQPWSSTPGPTGGATIRKTGSTRKPKGTSVIEDTRLVMEAHLPDHLKQRLIGYLVKDAQLVELGGKKY